MLGELRRRLGLSTEPEAEPDDTAFNTVVIDTIPPEGYMTEAELRYHTGSGWGR